MNYLQKPCKSLILIYQLVIIYVKKLVPSLESPIILDHSFRVSSVAFFIADSNLLSVNVYYCYIYTVVLSLSYNDIVSKQNKFPLLGSL